MQTQQRFQEKTAVGIGDTITGMLRDYSSDVNKALADLPDEQLKKGVKISINVKLEPKGANEILPSVKMKFATGKTVADSAIVDLKQEKLPGV